jgi:hypothetical protein
MYIFALVGCDRNNTKCRGTCNKIFDIDNSACKDLQDLVFLQKKRPTIVKGKETDRISGHSEVTLVQVRERRIVL